MFIFNFLASVFLLTLISMDHCLVILWPMWSQNHCTPAKYDLWNETPGSHQLWKEIIIPWYQMLVPSLLFFVFILPLAIITGCYKLVALKLRERQLVSLSGPCNCGDCLLPLLVAIASVPAVGLSMPPGRQSDLSQMALLISPLASSMAFINSYLNPILYIFIGHDFREHFLHSLPAALEQALSEEPDSSLNPSS
ncbi:N-formyl peptide receptor 2 [Plecturocebus cupreus]